MAEILSAVKNISVGLTQDDRILVDAAQEAWFSLKRTFDNWVTIGRGVACLRERANTLGGRNAFQRLMAENGFGELTTPKAKSTVSRLEQIMKPENLSRVQEWHNGLPPHEQVAWASPTSVIRRCPIFAVPSVKRKHPKPKSPAPIARDLTIANERIAELEQELASVKTKPTPAGTSKQAKGNPLTSIPAGDIVDLIFQLPKKKVAAICHDLVKEIQSRQKSKSTKGTHQ